MIVNVTYRMEFETEVEVSRLEDAQTAADTAKWRAVDGLHPTFLKVTDEDGEEIKCPECGGQKIVDGEDNPLLCLDCQETW